MLRHLDDDHPEVLALLGSAVARTRLRAGAGETVRPLGIDRFGYRLRIEGGGGSRDVRVPFARPLTCPGQVNAATSQLLCALRAGLARRD
jgi:hypothetical protein